MLRFNLLNFPERAAFTRAMTAMITMGHEGRQRLADTPFGQWLDDHRQPPSLVTKMYDPIVISALNEETRRASAAYAIQVFQESLLSNAAGYPIGLPACHLSQLYASLPLRDLRLGARVSSLRIANNTAQGVELTTGEYLPADAVLIATNHHTLRKFVGDDAYTRDPRFAHLDQIEDVPILGAHLWFDRPVLKESHAALVEGPLQWLFRKDEQGAAVHGVISAARAWSGIPRDTALEQFTRQIRATLPGARRAKLLRGVTVVEKRATFSPTPGIDRLRPTQAPGPTSVQRLYLAGDYTQTHWPATMEGAVRSGYLAASAIASKLLHKPHQFVVPDLPTQWPSRLLGL